MKRSSLRHKLNRSYIVLVSAIVLMMLVGSVLMVCFGTLPNIKLTMQSKTNELQNRINEQMAYMERAADTAFLNLNDIKSEILFGSKTDPITRYSSINNKLYLMRQIYSDVSAVFLIDTDGNVYADNSLLEGELAAGFDHGLNKILEDRHGQTCSFGLREVNGLGADGPMLLAGKMVRYIDNIRLVGYLYVVAESSLLDELFSEQMISSEQRIYLLDSDGRVMTSNVESALGSVPGFSEREGSDRLFVFYDGGLWLYRRGYVESLDADIVIMIPALEIYRNTGASILVILLSCLAGLVIAVVESAGISRRILTPLQELTDTVNEISSGNLGIRCKVKHTEDETGVLAASFNSMLDRVETLLLQLKQEQEEKLRTELSTQQNRLQPHFLYNALNSINALCEMGQNESAARMSRLTSDYYRSVLSSGKDIVTVEQELCHVETYLQIALMRRADHFKYSIDCDESARALPIPKLTIQPLVENSIKHAFRSGKPNRLFIFASAEGEVVSITVADNGVGMDPDIINEHNEACDHGHFGIFSVCRRMKLLCGGDYSLRADSVPGEGTKIYLRYNSAGIPGGEL